MTANLPEEKRSPHALTCRDFGTWFITRRVARKDKKMLNCHTKCKKKPIIISSTIQVEDVNKKFEALKDAESRAWVEERKPPPQPKRLVKVKSLHVHTCLHYNSTVCYTSLSTFPKTLISLTQKPSVAPVKPTGSKAAAKSRLAAVKAAMKARQQAAENINSNAEEPQTESQPTESVVFDGGFFQVESPAKPPGERKLFQPISMCSCSLFPDLVELE